MLRRDMLGTLRTLVQGARRHAVATTATLPGMLLSIAPLQPSAGTLALAARGRKVMSALKRRCEHCWIVRRGKISYVNCEVNPRHKARNGPKRRKKYKHNGPI